MQECELLNQLVRRNGTKEMTGAEEEEEEVEVVEEEELWEVEGVKKRKRKEEELKFAPPSFLQLPARERVTSFVPWWLHHNRSGPPPVGRNIFLFCWFLVCFFFLIHIF